MEEEKSYSETIQKEPIGFFGKTEAPPAYADLFPNKKNVKSLIEKTFEKKYGPVPSSAVAVPLTLCRPKYTFCGCCYLLLAVIPTAMIVIGSVYLYNCTLQDKIPIFLIVFGCVNLLQTCCNQRNDDDEDNNEKFRSKGSVYCYEGCVTLFLFIWIIIGSIFTFSAWNNWVDNGRQSCSAGGDNCCSPVLMYLNFSTLLVTYGINALSLYLDGWRCYSCTWSESYWPVKNNRQ